MILLIRGQDNLHNSDSSALFPVTFSLVHQIVALPQKLIIITIFQAQLLVLAFSRAYLL